MFRNVRNDDDSTLTRADIGNARQALRGKYSYYRIQADCSLGNRHGPWNKLRTWAKFHWTNLVLATRELRTSEPAHTRDSSSITEETSRLLVNSQETDDERSQYDDFSANLLREFNASLLFLTATTLSDNTIAKAQTWFACAEKDSASKEKLKKSLIQLTQLIANAITIQEKQAFNDRKDTKEITKEAVKLTLDMLVDAGERSQISYFDVDLHNEIATAFLGDDAVLRS